MSLLLLLLSLALARGPFPTAVAGSSDAAELSVAALQRRAQAASESLAAVRAQIAQQEAHVLQSDQGSGGAFSASAGGDLASGVAGPSASVGAVMPVGGAQVRAARRGAAGAQAEILRAELAQAEAELAAEVWRLAHRIELARRREAYASERLRRAGVVEAYLAGRVFASPRARVERDVVRHRVRNLRSSQIERHGESEVLCARLAVLADVESRSLANGTIAGVDLASLPAPSAESGEGGPALVVRRRQIEAAERSRDVARADGRGRWSAGLALDAAPASRDASLRAGATYELPSWNRNRAGVAAADAGVAYAEQRRLAEQRRVRASRSEILLAWRAARAVAEAHPPEAQAQWVSELARADEGFRKGVVDLPLYLELDGQAAEAFERGSEADERLIEVAAVAMALVGAGGAR